MQCPKCQAEVVEQASFCQSCGTRVAPTDVAGATEGVPEGVLSPRSGTTSGREEPEKELWQGNYSPKATIPAYAVAGFVSVAVIIGVIAFTSLTAIHWLWLLLAIVIAFGAISINLWITRLSTAYRLTSQRFMHETGLLRRVTNRLEVIDIDDVTIEQGLIDRFLGIGTIKLTSSDRTHPMLQMRGVDNVRVVADQIDNARRVERMRRGLHIEAI